MPNSHSLSRPESRVNFEDLKEAFPLRDVLQREFGISVRKGQQLIPCPFHDDKKPSFSIFRRGRKELFKCHSAGCGKSGSVLDLVWESHPELRDKAAATLAHLSGNYGGGTAPFLAQRRNPRSVDLARGGNHEAGGTTLREDAITLHSLNTVHSSARVLRSAPLAREPREYAQIRGWLPDEGQIYGADPYPVGNGNYPYGRLKDYNLVLFPKLIRTEKTAFLFGLEKEFANERELCIGMRFRLTPQAVADLWRRRDEFDPPIEREGDISRHMVLKNHPGTVPGEIDANENAEVLVIVEGPGDAVRLYNEVHITPAVAKEVGTRWHITYVDSASMLSPLSLERKVRKVPQTNNTVKLEPVSFFGGYKLILIMFDQDEAGCFAANMATWLAHRQAPRTAVKTVALPAGQDLGDFFDSGAHARDLTDIIRATKHTRGLDHLNEPPPEPPAKPHQRSDNTAA